MSFLPAQCAANLFFVCVVCEQVLLDDAISSVELVNCQRMQVQVRGSVPSVAVDKTDGFLCYLGKDGMETTFVTSKVRFFPPPGFFLLLLRTTRLVPCSWTR